jgi:hypothetical protein
VTDKVKKICKYTILLSIKESYLFIRNLFGLWFHPYKTLTLIKQERDYSQAVLILGIPFYIIFLGTLFIFISRYLIGAPSEWGLLARSSFYCLFFVSFAVFIYMTYWGMKVRKD